MSHRFEQKELQGVQMFNGTAKLGSMFGTNERYVWNRTTVTRMVVVMSMMMKMMMQRMMVVVTMLRTTI